MSNGVPALTSEQALLELTIRNAEQSQQEFDDVFIAGMRSGLAAELLTRMEDLWSKTLVVAGEMVAVGKIVIAEIVAFFKENPGLSIGAAIGASLGVLVATVPFLGPLLAPIATLAMSLYGAGIGATAQDGQAKGNPLDVAVALARKFFEMLIRIFNAVAGYVQTNYVK
jgi:hypothetical protein